MAEASAKCIIAEYSLCDVIRNVNHHLAEADKSAPHEVQRLWTNTLSLLVGIVDDRFTTLAAFGESDFDPREVNTIHATFVDMLIHARTHSFASPNLPEPSKDEFDAAMTRLALESSSATDAAPMRGHISYIDVPPMPRHHRDMLPCDSQKGLMQDLEAHIMSLEEEQDRLKCDNNKATGLLNKLHGTSSEPEDLTAHMDGFNHALYFVHRKQAKMAADCVVLTSALRQAGVSVPTLSVEEPETEADDDDKDREENDKDAEM
ncbi:hypothetical protein BKA93DRAFT_826554 [Sparassis latifolia]